MTRTIPVVFLVLLASCAKQPPATPVPPPPARVAPFDRTALVGPFPPEPVQPLPDDPAAFRYTVVTLDPASQRAVLDPDTLAVEVLPGVWRSYPLLVELSVEADSALCLPPPERCRTFQALRDWLGAAPAGPDTTPPVVPPLSLSDLEYLAPPAPPYMHLDTDRARQQVYGATQIEPLSKRVVLDVASLESNDQDHVLRLASTLPEDAVICVEVSMVNSQHAERCTVLQRVRAWLLTTGTAAPAPGPEAEPRIDETLAAFTQSALDADAAMAAFTMLPGFSWLLSGRTLLVTPAAMAAIEAQLQHSTWWRNESDGDVTRIISSSAFTSWLRAR